MTAWLIRLAAVCLCSAAVAWQVSSLHYTAKIARIEQAHAEQSARRQADALASLLQAQQLGDQLTARLQAQEQANAQIQKDKDHALRQTTTGRTCLGADAVRVLNSANVAPNVSPNVPAPTTVSAAAGEPIATDTDVASWISDTQARFEQCRQRLDALIDFHQ